MKNLKLTPIESIKESFRKSFNQSWRKDFLKESFKKLKSPDKVLLFFSRYISFNSIFAGGVARLAGAAHLLQSCFMGSEINFSKNIYSKSSEIASNIFAAAEDEFNAKHEHERITHRNMARFFLDSTKEYFNKMDFEFNQNDLRLELLLDEVMNGYCTRNIPTDELLLNGMGFHIASEELADQEFIAINTFLTTQFGDLVSFLKNKKHQSELSAFYWVEIHCDVEKEHHDYAIKALEIAFKNYSGILTNSELQIKFENGYQRFCTLQERMINYCCDV